MRSEERASILPDARLFVLGPVDGLRVSLTDYGARLIGIDAPDRAGRTGRVLLGFDRIADCVAEAAPGGGAYLGATCGRVANRIAGAGFVLDGIWHRLAANEGEHQRHGGPHGFDRVLWEVVAADQRRVVLRHRSPDGDQGYPGALSITAMFTLAGPELTILYEATTTRPTHVNLVSHGYFNLGGAAGRSVGDHRLRIAAAAFLPIDAENLPTGARRAVAGTVFDFTTPRTLGEGMASDDPQLRPGRGYNHNFCLTGAGLRPVAWLFHPASGRMLTVSSDQPGLQLYSGGWLSGSFAPHSGLCLETQGWPDACNRPDFPSTRLDPGQVYRSETRLRFGVA
jgi:aldose 1-epimerase